MLPKCLVFTLHKQCSISDSLTYMYSILQPGLDAKENRCLQQPGPASMQNGHFFSFFLVSEFMLNCPSKILKKRLKVLFHFVSEEAASSKTGGGHMTLRHVRFFPICDPICGSFQLYYWLQTIAFIPLIQKLEIKKTVLCHPECQSPDATPYIVHL